MARTELAEFRARGVETAFIEIDGSDARAGLGEADCRGAADPAAPARYDANTA
jgi:hypothetical protein